MCTWSMMAPGATDVAKQDNSLSRFWTARYAWLRYPALYRDLIPKDWKQSWFHSVVAMEHACKPSTTVNKKEMWLEMLNMGQYKATPNEAPWWTTYAQRLQELLKNLTGKRLGRLNLPPRRLLRVPAFFALSPKIRTRFMQPWVFNENYRCADS